MRVGWLLLTCIAGCAGADKPDAPAQVVIDTPIEGTFVDGPDVEVVLQVSGATFDIDESSGRRPWVEVVLDLDGEVVETLDAPRGWLTDMGEGVYLLGATLRGVEKDLAAPPPRDEVSFAVREP